MSGQREFNFQLAIDRVKEQLGYDFVGIALVDTCKQHYELRWRYVTGNKSKRYRKIVLQSGKGIAGLVFKTGKPLLAEDADQLPGEQDLYNYPIVALEGLKSFGAIPLFKNDHVRGVLLIGYRQPGKLTEAAFEQFKQEIGSQFGAFYTKERMKL